MTPTDDRTTPADRTLLRNGVVHTSRAGRPATAVAWEDGRIVFVGNEDDAEAFTGAGHGAEVHDAGGALIAPAFVDAHVHSVLSGFPMVMLDLTDARSLTHTLELVAAFAAQMGEESVILGSRWEETSWPEGRAPTAADLDRVAPGKRICLDRIDAHSSVVSTALAAAVPGLSFIDGYEETGRVSRDARYAVYQTLGNLVGPDQRREAARAAHQEMARQGIAAFHENAAPHLGPEYEVDLVREVAEETGLLATIYWGELLALETAARLGVAGLAGDLNADGALGSRTAALRAPYADEPHCGHAYLEADQIADHVIACTEVGLQAGFHCIGDAGIDNIAEGFTRAVGVLGRERVRAARHRLEHVEMAGPEAIATLADFGVTASMQPVFDRYWGGPDLAYAARLGDRWRGMNPLGSMHRAGMAMAFGSDSPVTTLRPWEAVDAAVTHREVGQEVPLVDAFAAHTRGGWRAARIDDAGSLRVGWAAHLAVWSCPDGLTGAPGLELPVLGQDRPSPTLQRLVVDGVHVRSPGWDSW